MPVNTGVLLFAYGVHEGDGSCWLICNNKIKI